MSWLNMSTGQVELEGDVVDEVEEEVFLQSPNLHFPKESVVNLAHFYCLHLFLRPFDNRYVLEHQCENI